MQALVYKSTGSWYTVKNSEGRQFNARIKGKFKIDGFTSTNPIAVGDNVEIENEEDPESVVITEIRTRKNYINRVSPHNRNQHHIVAANLDQTLLFATLREPKTSLGFIDRFLVTAEAFHLPAIVVFNKADLLKAKDITKFAEIKEIYQNAGYQLLLMSLETGAGINEAKNHLINKTTLLSGHSGVGKSTFINHLFPDLDLKTQHVSDWSGKGLHTTTFAEMFDLSFGGKVIDTPGIRELGLADITKQDLAHYFPEMRRAMHDCQFNNCMHTEEPGCAVKAEVNSGSISEQRYLSYLTIRESLIKKSWE